MPDNIPIIINETGTGIQQEGVVEVIIKFHGDILSVGAQVGADPLPQVVDAASAPVRLCDEASAEFHTLRDPRQHRLAVIEQAGGVQAAQAVRR